MPAAQTAQENCVAHNGSLIPVPGRDIMAQAWYQGGVSIIRLHRSRAPQGDRLLRSRADRLHEAGPTAATGRAYYYNGYLYGSEMARGLDIFKLTPTADLTQNEIDAANLVRFAAAQRADPAEARLARRIPGRARLRRPARA